MSELHLVWDYRPSSEPHRKWREVRNNVVRLDEYKSKRNRVIESVLDNIAWAMQQKNYSMDQIGGAVKRAAVILDKKILTREVIINAWYEAYLKYEFDGEMPA